MILHFLRMRRNVNRNVFNDRKNVSATALPKPPLCGGAGDGDVTIRRFVSWDFVA